MTDLLARYEALVASGELRPDPEQAAAAERLDALQRELEATSASRGLLGKLLAARRRGPRGVYMWGGVGRGKSMLMDLFHESLEIRRKRRVHFHAFMLEVHARLREERKKEAGDPIPPVAAAFGAGAALPRLRRDGGEQFGRRDDHEPAVHLADRRSRRHHRHHLEPRAVASSTRTGSTASISCRSSR